MKPTAKRKRRNTTSRYHERRKKPVTPHDKLGSTIAAQHKKARKALVKANRESGLTFGVAFLGSARTAPGDSFYDRNVEAARAVAALGYPLIHGGGPGNMRATAQGVRDAGGYSLALCLHLGRDVKSNPDNDLSIWFDDFSPRIDTFRHLARVAMVFFPGGIGTLHEAMSVIDNIMQKKAPPRPIVFFEPDEKRPFWAPFFAWLEQTVMANGLLKKSEIGFVHIARSKEELVSIIQKELGPAR